MDRKFTEEDATLLTELGVEAEPKKATSRTPREDWIVAGFEGTFSGSSRRTDATRAMAKGETSSSGFMRCGRIVSEHWKSAARSSPLWTVRVCWPTGPKPHRRHQKTLMMAPCWPHSVSRRARRISPSFGMSGRAPKSAWRRKSPAGGSVRTSRPSGPRSSRFRTIWTPVSGGPVP